jgi:uncharacterized repeat protein (TIGR03803 family)
MASRKSSATSNIALVAIAPVVLALLASTAAFAQTLPTLHRFAAQSGGTIPLSGTLLADQSANLYGTTNYGGASNDGTVFELSPPVTDGAWTETVLHSFAGGSDGVSPTGHLVADAVGNLYGVTAFGGSGSSGIVYQLVPPATTGGGWTENVLYSFQGFADGSFPSAGLIFDSSGNLYGETGFGGSCATNQGSGTIYELSPPTVPGNPWTKTTLFSFTQNCGGTDGHSPSGGLVLGKGGALYGTTTFGGAPQGTEPAEGTVFRLGPPVAGKTEWTFSTLHTFTVGTDGMNPRAGVVFDSKGNLYGTTQAGGDLSACPSGTPGCGTAFELSPAGGGVWNETIIYAFTGGNDGGDPFTPLLVDGNGNLYGTATNGGVGTCAGSQLGGCGSVFKLIPPSTSGGTWTEVTLHTFTGTSSDEGMPYSGVIFGKNHRLFGTVAGNNLATPKQYGTVFKVVP